MFHQTSKTGSQVGRNIAATAKSSSLKRSVGGTTSKVATQAAAKKKTPASNAPAAGSKKKVVEVKVHHKMSWESLFCPVIIVHHSELTVILELRLKIIS